MRELRTIIDKIESGGRVSTDEALKLWDHAPLALLGRIADRKKRDVSGDKVYYNRNIHIEPTNICEVGCSFCSYRRDADSPQAWNHPMEYIESVAGKHSENITEIHIVGGVHPDYKLDHYVDMIRRVRRAAPHASIKAFTAVELFRMFVKSEVSVPEGIRMLKEAGLAAIPGGGAEIFDHEIRTRICPQKGSAQEWLAVHQEAHRQGLPTNATILYGHVEFVKHRFEHLELLRNLQDETHGFDAFIPLKYKALNNEMSQLGEVSVTEDLRMVAMSRIFLDNFDHIKAYWPMYGKVTTELALSFGADDIDGTIEDTTRIYSMAGSEETHPRMSVAGIEAMVASAGLRAVERDTFYNTVEKK